MELGELLGEGSFGKVYKIKKTDNVIKYIHLPSDGFYNYIEPYILLNISCDTIMNANHIIISPNNLLKIVQKEAIDMSKLERRKLRNERSKIYENVKDGLTYLHSNNILHGDLKPSNILYSDGIYKLNDFSFSMLLESDPQKIDIRIYTTEFRPPEVDKKIVSLRSDVWAFGKILLTLFSKSEKKEIVEYTRFDIEDRPFLIKPEKFNSDSELLEKNKHFSFKNNRHQKVFCQKLRNKGKIVSCSKEYRAFESSLCNEWKFKINI